MHLMEILPLFIILFTLIVAFIMPVFARWKREFCAPITIATMTIIFVMAITLTGRVFAGEIISYHVADWAPPWGIEILIDPLSSIMLCLITGICLLIAIYSYSSLKKEIVPEAIGWYYTLFLLLVGAMMGMVVTNDLFNMFVMIEVTGISACALVIAKGDRISSEATLKYLLLATIGSGFFLCGIGFLYMITGNLNITYIALELKEISQNYPFLLWATMSFMVVGLGVKSALFPLHIWLPDAHSSAPSPSSAVLSSLVVKVYIVAMLKIFFIIFGIDVLHFTYIRHLLLLLSSAAMIGGSLFAFVQLDLKRRLAYSTVAQIGYIYLGFSLGTFWGLTAAILHIIVHAFMKTCLFLSAGAIYYQTGRKKVTEFTGMGYRMPVTMAAFTVASLSMVGIPLFGGFITKFGLALGSLEANSPMFIVLIVISGLLNAMYYFPILWQAYFASEEEHHEFKLQRDRIPLSMLIPIGLLAIGIIWIGILPGAPLSLIQKAVSQFLL